MAFTVEDGTGLSNSNAYISLADFLTHHADRGITVVSDGTYSDAEMEAGIVNATDYIDKRFGRRFRGDKASREQELEWPRTDAYSDEEYLLPSLPRQLEKATAEYALIATQLGRNLAPPPAPTFGIQDPATGDVSSEGSGQVTEKAEEVGPIKESTKWADAKSTNKPMVGTGNLIQSIPEYPQADLWIEEIIEPYASRRVLRG